LRRLTGALFLLFLLTVITGAAGLIWLRHQITQPGPLPAATAFVVPHQGLAPLSETLQDARIVNNALVFRLAALLTRADGPLHAAEFAFPPHATIDDVLVILRTARPVLHRVTIPEGLTARQITAIIDHADAAEGDTPPIAEGQVFPDTYEFERGTSRAALVAHASARMQDILDQEWQDRVAGLPLVSPAQALTLASIVERETALPAERPEVAAVFLNRLRIGMKLESDPTVVYGASAGMGRLDRPISRADLNQVTAYNTYIIPGLPPGPIASPGRAALHAVMHPADSEALYFVANGTGGHSFAATLAEHQQNVARWRKLGH